MAESEASESESQTAFDKLKQDNAVARATKNADAKSKASEVKSLEVSLGNYKEDKATTSDELDAVLSYLDKLKPQCHGWVLLGKGYCGVCAKLSVLSAICCCRPSHVRLRIEM